MNPIDFPKRYEPLNKRNEEWLNLWMDAIENYGRDIVEMKRRMYSQVYRQVAGDAKIGANEVSTLRQLADSFGNEHRQHFAEDVAEREFKHFDIIGGIIDTLTQKFLEIEDAIRIDTVDKESRSEYLDMKTEIMYKSVEETIKAHINQILILNEYETEIDPEDPEAEQKQQALLQEIEKIKAQYNLGNLDNNLKKSYRNVMVEFCERTIEEDAQRFSFQDKDRVNLLDFLISGSYFRVPRLGLDYYTVDIWRQYDVFYMAEANETDPQKSYIIGRNKWMYPHEIIEQYGKWLTFEQKEAIINNAETFLSTRNNGTHSLADSLLNFNQRIVRGTEADLERISNRFVKVPIQDGESVLDEHLKRYAGDEDNTYGKIEVTESYFKTYKKTGFLRFMQDGEIVNEIVSEEIMPEFLKFYEITQLKNVTKDEFIASNEVNVIYWELEEEVRWRAKINNSGVTATNKSKNKDYINIYIGSEDPLEVELLTESNFINKRMPVCGVMNRKSRIKEVSDYQALHNLCMNEMMDFIERDLGIVTFYNYALLNGILDGDDQEDSMKTVWSILKEIGTVPYSSNDKPQQGTAAPNPMHVYNLSMHDMIRTKYEMAQVFKQEALRILEIVPMQPIAQTQNGLEVTNVVSTAVTETIYDEYREGIIRFYDTLCEVAKYAKYKNIDNAEKITANIEQSEYINSDPTKLLNRRAKVFPQNSPKERRELKELQQMIYMNTIKGTFEERAMLKTVNSTTAFLEKSKQIAQKAEEAVQMQRQWEEKMQQDKIIAEQEKEKRIHENRKEIEMIKGEIALKKQALLSAGFQKNDADKQELYNQAQDELDELDRRYGEIIENRKSQMAELDRNQKDNNRDREFQLKEQEIQLKKEEIEMKRDTAILNKNKWDFPNPKKAKSTKDKK